MELTVGNFMYFSSGGVVQYRFQNFFIQQSVTYAGAAYTFAPFGFSGVTINRSGDNTEATLMFPNNELSRNWTVEAVEQQWLANVQVMLLDPADSSQFNRLHQYWGRVSNAKWDDSSVSLTLSTILDAVGGDIPARRLTQKLIGAIPVTSNLRLQ
jgi:phage-related protein